MNSRILNIAQKYLKILFVVFGVLILLRGHNYPGGGFIGGLLASLAYVFQGLLKGADKQASKSVSNGLYLGLGLSLILLSVLPGFFMGNAMQGIWWDFSVGGWDLKVGSPFLFDVGVFCVVIGVSQLFFYSLSRY